MKRVRIAFALFVAALLALQCDLAKALPGREPSDITGQCTISVSSNAKKKTALTDGNAATAWKSAAGQGQSATIALPAGASLGGIFLQWAALPGAWKLEGSSGGQWSDIVANPGGQLHEFISFSGEYDQLRVTNEGNVPLAIAEANVYDDTVDQTQTQWWLAPAENTDLMVVAAHPDDDQLYVGSTMSYYAGERGMTVQAVYMTCDNINRMHEALNGLWTVGVQNYPVFGGFRDKLTESLSEAKKYWDEQETIGFLVEQIRRCRPKVILSHDVNGEYGHGAHRMTAWALQQALKASGDSAQYPQSAVKYGVWTVPKCYLHLYAENQIKIDMRQPLSAFGGKTTLDMAKLGYACHLSQQKWSFKVLDSGKYDCSKFGLCYTNVGNDVARNDFFENITPDAVYGLNPTPTPSEPTPAPTPSPEQSPTSQPQASATSAEQTASPTPEPTATAAAKVQQPGFWQAIVNWFRGIFGG